MGKMGKGSVSKKILPLLKKKHDVVRGADKGREETSTVDFESAAWTVTRG